MTAQFRFPRFFVTSPTPCPYLPGRQERKVFTELTGAHASELNDALGKIGPLAVSSEGWAAFNDIDRLTDEHYPELLGLLRDGSVPFEDLVDEIVDDVDDRYEFAGALADDEWRRALFSRAAAHLVARLHQVGAAQRIGAIETPHPRIADRVEAHGGDIILTDLGRWWLGAPAT